MTSSDISFTFSLGPWPWRGAGVINLPLGSFAGAIPGLFDYYVLRKIHKHPSYTKVSGQANLSSIALVCGTVGAASSLPPSLMLPSSSTQHVRSCAHAHRDGTGAQWHSFSKSSIGLQHPKRYKNSLMSVRQL